MIPRANIQEWAATTPWPDPRQVEQDLIICRALCDIFNEPYLAERLAFRGGTAIHKLLFRHPLRYSEDIDLVQVRPERSLTDDIRPMLAADVVYRDDDALEAFERVWLGLIVGLKGEAWHKSDAVIDEFRSTSLPKLLRRASA